MDSAPAPIKTDAVRLAVASCSSCSLTTIATLKELLGPDHSHLASKRPLPQLHGQSRHHLPASKHKAQGENILSSHDKQKLAIFVINSTLKSLSQVVSSAAGATKSCSSEGGLGPHVGCATLKRSTSGALSPLKGRALNRASTLPTDTATTPKGRCLPGSTSHENLAAIECARIALKFAWAERPLDRIKPPGLELERALSRLIDRLLKLQLHDLALTELNVLKSWLCSSGGRDSTSTPCPPAKDDFPTLLEFAVSDITDERLELVAIYQVQVLHLLAILKKPSYIEQAVPFLRETHKLSVIQFLRQQVERRPEESNAISAKLSRIYRHLLDLGPSTASSQDAVALDCRLSPSPDFAFELQALGLRTRLLSWKTSGKSDVDLEAAIMSPLSKCILAYFRRAGAKLKEAYRCAVTAHNRLDSEIQIMGLSYNTASSGARAAIFQSLGTTARSLSLFDDAMLWTTNLKSIANSSTDSAARNCWLSISLLTLNLDRESYDDNLVSLLRETTNHLRGPMRGSSEELDSLIQALSSLRKVAVRTLESLPNEREIDLEIRNLLEGVLLYYPRFTVRWLGPTPSLEGNPRDLLRHEERRRFLSPFLCPTIDATMRTVKMCLHENRQDSDQIHEALNYCIELLDTVDDPRVATEQNNQPKSYRVGISTLYSMLYRNLSQSDQSGDFTPALRALQRSIDVVRNRPIAERQQAKLTSKLELYASSCRQRDLKLDARDALRLICTILVEENVLTRLASAMLSQHPTSAWTLDDQVQLLSRTLCNIAKLDNAWTDWTLLLPELERAAVLEHVIHVIIPGGYGSGQTLDLDNPAVSALLVIYEVDKHPIRRFRTLLHLVTSNNPKSDHHQTLRSDIDSAVAQIEANDVGQDHGLVSYVPHLRSYLMSVDSLTSPPVNVFSSSAALEAVAAWMDMAQKCSTRAQLLSVIDSPARLLVHLKSCADFASMKGESDLLIAVLQLSEELCRILSGTFDDLGVLMRSLLVAHYVDIGDVNKAGRLLEAVKLTVQKSTHLSAGTMTQFHLSSAEHLVNVGNVEQAELALAQAKNTFADCVHDKTFSKSQKRKLITLAACLLYKIALHRGEIHHSMVFLRHGARVMAYTWKTLEEAHREWKTMQTSSVDVSDSALAPVKQTDCPIVANGSAFWGLTYPLLRCTLHLSSTYDHLGLYQETVFFAKKAEAIADFTGSSIYKAQVAVWTGRLLCKAGKRQEAVKFVERAKTILPRNSNPLATTLACELSDVCRRLDDLDSEKQILDLVAERVSAFESEQKVDGHMMEVSTLKKKKQQPVPITAAATATARITARQQKPVRKVPMTSAADREKSRTAKKKCPPSSASLRSITPEFVATAEGGSMVLEGEVDTKAALIASVYIHRALSLMHRREYSLASTMLQNIKGLPKSAAQLARQQFITASCLIRQSMEQMISDPVFAVLPDSTISFPSISDSPIISSEASSPLLPSSSPELVPANTTLLRTTRSRAARIGDGGGSTHFIEALKRAQECLMESHSIAVSVGDGWLLFRIAALLQNTSILLSATSSTIFRSLGCSGYATSSVELARNVTWRRERKATLVEAAAVEGEDLEWPPPSPAPSDHRRSSLGFTNEMARFQKDFVEVIPKQWNVVALSLSDSRRDVCITKLQNGHSPLVLRIPLIKQDTDGQVLTFERGHERLLKILRQANETCHNGGTSVVSEWWAERKALDQQLKELLFQIESTWFCGFRGIFSQHARRPDLVLKFQKSLHRILDKHLPSRRPGRGGRRGKATCAAKITLDPRILDLFIGLGDPTTDSVDFSDSVEDLLNFVVDVLQFHGEQNPYDEIDYETMVVDAVDALRAYHALAARSSPPPASSLVPASELEEGSAHTILVLDNALQCFPWESLPCLRGRSVSRVPSLACLRRLITEQRRADGGGSDDSGGTGRTGTQSEDEARERRDGGADRPGHYVSGQSGAYILNPSGDLAKTLASFEQPLGALGPGWAGIVSRAPTEEEFEQALAKRDLVLYFGHGSGSQYIRPKTVRRMRKCRAAVLLMGCSSASLPDVGDFERQGPVRNYMMAGCPAVVGTLWDVTDRDIDRLARRIFEEWGLLPPLQPAGIGAQKGKKAAEEQKVEPRRGGVSLPQAVAAARDVCILKYLTAAAVCVYGVPVYVEGAGE